MRVKSLTQWYPQPLSVHTKDQQDWLFVPGFLTIKLKLLGKYSIKLLNQGQMAAGISDAAALGIAAGSNIWFREVLMCLDDKPCIIGRSIAAVDDLKNSWPQLLEHGNSAIGYVLYEDPSVHRTSFECAQLNAGDALEIIARNYDQKSDCLNARRSRFIKNNSNLLVSECFLYDFWAMLE